MVAMLTSWHRYTDRTKIGMAPKPPVWAGGRQSATPTEPRQMARYAREQQDRQWPLACAITAVRRGGRVDAALGARPLGQRLLQARQLAFAAGEAADVTWQSPRRG